jgi:hypothetical protein
MDKKVNLIAGFDVGTKYSHNQISNWIGSVLILQREHSTKLKYAARVEYFKDPTSIIIPFIANDLTKTIFGYSLNIDYWLRKKLAFRIEGKYLKGSSDIFSANKLNQWSVTSNITFVLN